MNNLGTPAYRVMQTRDLLESGREWDFLLDLLPLVCWNGGTKPQLEEIDRLFEVIKHRLMELPGENERGDVAPCAAGWKLIISWRG